MCTNALRLILTQKKLYFSEPGPFLRPVVAFVRSCLPFFILGGQPEGPEAKKSGRRRANRKESQMIDLSFIRPGSQSFGSPAGRQDNRQAI